MNYIPINIKTNYEFLNSMIKIDELVNILKENNITSASITDSNMHACYEFYKECIKNNIKPILGTTVIINEVKLYLYAKNYEGYQNLCKIVSLKNIEGLTIDTLKANNTSIICILDYNNKKSFKEFLAIYPEIYIGYKNKTEEIEALLTTQKVIFNPEILCINKEDIEYLPYLYKIKDGKTIKDDTKYDIKNNYLIQEINKIDIERLNEFCDKINIKFPESKFLLPKFDKDKDSFNLLKSLCKLGLEKRLKGKVEKKYVDRLIHELNIIGNMNFADYFLVVYDFIKYAKQNGIVVGPGRGSSVGSLVSYTLGITEIDPLKYNLIFERFLNPERISMPDIDIDFEYIRRSEVIEYVKKKYGYNNVANIIAFGTLLPKAVLRDVGRVLDIDISSIDDLIKTIKYEETFKELENNKIFMNFIKEDKELIKLLSISKKFEGLKRHSTIHAAGVIISPIPLYQKIPLYKSGDSVLTGYSMGYLEELGLLKMDFLSIRNLSYIESAIKLIKEFGGKEIKLNDIPFDDKLTLKLFYYADTSGIFQFESEGMREFLRKLKSTSFNDIIAALALYRPGPRENIGSYIKRKEGKEKITYIIPELEPILKDTYGIIVYQEQILEILRKVADFTYAEADAVRKAMSKKNRDTILKEKERFINNCIKNKIEKSKAIKIYEMILKFAEYGFPKAHSVSYAVVAYYMGYLKAHYPEYYMATLLNFSVGSQIKTKEYIDEAKIIGLLISKPNINKSYNKYVVSNKKLLLPFSLIKNVGKEVSLKIIEERKNNTFTDFFDFVKRTYGGKINKKVLENLIYAGAFDSFNVNKNTLINNLESAINYAMLCKDLDESLVEKPIIKEYEELKTEELMIKEFDLFGFYISSHPVTKYKRDNKVKLKDLEKYFDKVVSSIVLIDKIKTINTKNNEKMAFLTISDDYAKAEAVLFPKVFERYYAIESGSVIEINGKIEKRMGNYQIIINNIEVL